MGQYHRAVNLTKREFIDPHQLANGLKLWEQLGGREGGVQDALIVLLAVSNGRGGGDLGEDDAGEIVGRWGGDQVAIVGDYAENGDLPNSPVPAENIWELLCTPSEEKVDGAFTDITPKVCAYLEKLYGGKYLGQGWRRFVVDGSDVTRWKSDKRQPGKVVAISDAEVTVAWDGDETKTYPVTERPEFFS